MNFHYLSKLKRVKFAARGPGRGSSFHENQTWAKYEYVSRCGSAAVSSRFRSYRNYLSTNSIDFNAVLH